MAGGQSSNHSLLPVTQLTFCQSQSLSENYLRINFQTKTYRVILIFLSLLSSDIRSGLLLGKRRRTFVYPFLYNRCLVSTTHYTNHTFPSRHKISPSEIHKQLMEQLTEYSSSVVLYFSNIPQPVYLCYF